MRKPCFGPKKFGVGLTPVSWSGWACVACLLVLFTTILVRFS
jgi:hypothetical protein